ncbi:MAG: TetR family transcriptional regulator [Steroidobacteraceae bacterium]
MRKITRQPTRKPVKPRRIALRTGETRARILAAAKVRFSRDNYDNVGVRDIASDVGVDAALVNRYFGTKARLFEEVLKDAFCMEEHVPPGLDSLGRHIAGKLTSSRSGCKWCENGDPLQLLLLAAASPTASTLASKAFHAEFVKPLTRRLRGPDAALRASLICAYILGFKTMRAALDSPSLRNASSAAIAARLGKAIQDCV